MILGYHAIFGAYGFWLPNDPRGSWSEFVGSWELFRYGPATKISTRASVAGVPHDREQRRQAKQALERSAVTFTGEQARAVGRGFHESARKGKVAVWACAILPEHVHLVVGRHTATIEAIVNLFKGAATRRLLAEGIHPFADLIEEDRVPNCWARGEWKVFLDSEEDIVRAIAYVNDNPLKEGKRRQSWQVVTPYHSPMNV